VDTRNLDSLSIVVGRFDRSFCSIALSFGRKPFHIFLNCCCTLNCSSFAGRKAGRQNLAGMRPRRLVPSRPL